MWSPIQHSPTQRSCMGKFVLFLPTADSLNSCWHIVQATTRSGLLGGGAKFVQNGNAGGTILVYTEEDKQIMLDIAVKLTLLLELKCKIYWKHDSQTALKQTGSKYYFDPTTQSILDR